MTKKLSPLFSNFQGFFGPFAKKTVITLKTITFSCERFEKINCFIIKISFLKIKFNIGFKTVARRPVWLTPCGGRKVPALIYKFANLKKNFIENKLSKGSMAYSTELSMIRFHA